MLKIRKLIFMIPVTLSKKGNSRWFTQHSSPNKWDIDKMIIPRCARCLGIFIFWKSLIGNKIIYSVSGIHLTPGKPSYTKLISKELFSRLQNDVPKGEPYYIVFGGGKINTPQNKFLYKNSLRHYVLPLKRNFPGISIEMFVPEKNTLFTTLTLNEEGKVEATQYYLKN